MFTHSLPKSFAVLAAVAMLATGCDRGGPTDPQATDLSGADLSAPSFTSPNAGSSAVLGSAASFGVLAATTVTCTGASTIAGNVGVSPGSAITGFNPDCTLTGTIHAGDAVAASAQTDAAAAYGALSASNCDVTFGTVQELAGLTLNPGTYCFPSSAQLSVGGVLTLSGSGPFIFKITSTFVTFTGSQIVLTGGAACGDIYWLVGSSATLAGSVVGTIIAYTSIGMDPGATLAGRALALGGAVTMSGANTVALCGGGSGRDQREKCNQGVGNGPEGCDPGNSNQGDNRRSNDERGGTPGNPGRKGGNGK